MAYWAGGDLAEMPSDVPQQVAAFVASGRSLVSSARRVASTALTAANSPKQRKANTRRLKRAVKNLSSDLTGVDAAQSALFDAYPGVCDKPPGTITTLAPFDDRIHATADDINRITDDILWNTKRHRWADLRKDLARIEARVDEEFRYLDQLAPTDCWVDSVAPWRSAMRALEVAEREGTRWVEKRTDERWDAWIASLRRFHRANSDANGALNAVRIQATFGQCD